MPIGYGYWGVSCIEWIDDVTTNSCLVDVLNRPTSPIPKVHLFDEGRWDVLNKSNQSRDRPATD